MNRKVTSPKKISTVIAKCIPSTSTSSKYLRQTNLYLKLKNPTTTPSARPYSTSRGKNWQPTKSNWIIHLSTTKSKAAVAYRIVLKLAWRMQPQQNRPWHGPPWEYSCCCFALDQLFIGACSNMMWQNRWYRMPIICLVDVAKRLAFEEDTAIGSRHHKSPLPRVFASLNPDERAQNQGDWMIG